MARPLRIAVPDGTYHVMSRGNAKMSIYCDDSDRWQFLDILGKVVERYEIRCHAYCLMTNHYHLLLDTPKANLSAAVKYLNGVYALRWNRRYKRVGHVFQGRFKAQLVEKEAYFLTLCRYIVRNPIRAGVASRPHDWPWSSCRATAGMSEAPTWLTRDAILARFGTQPLEACKRYYRFVGEVHADTSLEPAWTRSSVIATPGYIESLRRRLAQADRSVTSRRERHPRRPSLYRVFEGAVTKQTRNDAIRLAWTDHEYSAREIATFLNVHYTTVTKVLQSPRLL